MEVLRDFPQVETADTLVNCGEQSGCSRGFTAREITASLGQVLGAVFLAIGADALSRTGSLVDRILGIKFSISTTVRLMEHSATLDLEQFEDSEVQDRLERARTQTFQGLGVMGQVFGQVQTLITIISFAAGLVVYAPWLIVLLLVALVPAFVGEAHFNALEYALQWSRTQQRRLLEYLRQTGASVETAKEVKIFGLNRHQLFPYTGMAMAARLQRSGTFTIASSTPGTNEASTCGRPMPTAEAPSASAL